jgi:hypothetical protein
MKNLKKLLALGLILALTASIHADAGKGKKLYQKKLKAACGFSGAKFAAKHTQDEWATFKDKLGEEIKIICPKSDLKTKYEKHIYDFAVEFASDSGNVPSC